MTYTVCPKPSSTTAGMSCRSWPTNRNISSGGQSVEHHRERTGSRMRQDPRQIRQPDRGCSYSSPSCLTPLAWSSHQSSLLGKAQSAPNPHTEGQRRQREVPHSLDTCLHKCQLQFLWGNVWFSWRVWEHSPKSSTFLKNKTCNHRQNC